MPSHSKRWGLLALFIVFCLTCLTPQPVLARNTYDLNDGSEGDPGDGVLKPMKPSIGSVRLPEVVRYYDAGTDRTRWVVPVFVLPADLSAVPVLMMIPMDAWMSDGRWAPSARGWHHAR